MPRDRLVARTLLPALLTSGSRHRGFTLIEVLIVLAIVSLVAAGVSLTVESLRQQDTTRELQRLRLVLEASAERARTHGQPLAFELLADGYRFSRLDTDGRWYPLEEGTLFAERVLPAGMAWAGLRGEHGNMQQRIVFSQRAPRFTLDIDVDGTRVRITGNPAGAVTLVERPIATGSAS